MNLSRNYFLVLVPLAVAMTALFRAFVKMAINRNDEGLDSHRVVAVGPAEDIVKFVADLDRTRTQVEVVAYVADDLHDAAEPPVSLAHLPRLPDRDSIRHLADHGIGVDLLVRAGRPGPDEVWAMGQRAHDLGVTVAIAPHREDATHSVALSYVPLGSTPLSMLETPTLRPSSAMAKVIFDRVVAAGLLVVLAPVFLVIAAVIAIRDGRPIFFCRTRAGRGGGYLECLKFRTMCTDAEDRLVDLQAGNEAGGLFNIKDAPPVAPTDRFLRAHSLDEIPQLIHVLKGQMSIFGPRPPLPSEVEQYDVRTIRRLLDKPGLTGLCRTRAVLTSRWDDGICLDLMDIDHWSPLLDLVVYSAYGVDGPAPERCILMLSGDPATPQLTGTRSQPSRRSGSASLDNRSRVPRHNPRPIRAAPTQTDNPEE